MEATAAHTVAFELRDAVAENFTGGSVSPNGRTINLAEALKEGGGKIVVNAVESPALVDALDNVPVLKRVGAPEEATPTTSTLEILTLAELRETAERLGAKPEGRSKQDYIDAIRAAQREEG